MLIIKWNKERFHLNFPQPSTTLGELRKYISDQTGLAPDAFKMLFGGGLMKEDNAPLRAYGIEDGNMIHIIGSRDIPATKPPQSVHDSPAQETVTSAARPTKQAFSTETKVIASIHSELNAIHNSIGPALKTFMESLDAGANVQDADMEFEHKRLGELLLQSLLRLDALSPDGQWIEARAERKKAVKVIQTMLDQLDSSWRSAFPQPSES